MERFSDLLDRKRDRSRLDFFFCSTAPSAPASARKDQGKSEEEFFGEAKEEKKSDCSGAGDSSY